MDQTTLHNFESRCTQESPPRCRVVCPFDLDARAFMARLCDHPSDLKKHATIVGAGIPSIKMIPDDMEIVYVQTPRKDGPFGASGVGEMPLTAPHPAIINAIYNACGARVRHLPARPEKVLEAMPK